MATTDADLTLTDLPQPERETTVPPDELYVDGDNPNSQNEETFGLLCDNMRKKGWIGNAIVTNTDGCIADGEHRWRAAQEIGLSEVPVKFYDIDDAERRLWRQELNKISGEHDKKRDALEYDTLLSAGKTEEVEALTDAADEDLDSLLAELRVDEPTGPTYEYDPEHNVYFEDCVDGMAERLEPNSIDCIITDPPYGIDVDLSDTMGSAGVDHIGDLENDGLEDALQLFIDTAAELERVLTRDGHAYVFSSWKTYDKFRDILESVGFNVKNWLVWCKSTPNHQPNFGTGGVNYGNQHEFILYATLEDGDPRPINDVMSDLIRHKHQTQDNEHPTQKPVGLIETFLEQSTDVGDRVIDPFMGSATTAVAAIQSDRDYVGFELDEKNYREIVERRIGEAKRQREASVNSDAE